MADEDGKEEGIDQHEGIEDLDGLDLTTAGLDDMVDTLRKLEAGKQGLLESIRMLRVRLADEKVMTRF